MIDGGDGTASRVQRQTMANGEGGASTTVGSAPEAQRKQACGASEDAAPADVAKVLWFVQPSGQHSGSLMTNRSRITTSSPATALDTPPV